MELPRALTGGRTPASETPRRVILWRLALACWSIGIVIVQARRACAVRLLPDGFTYYAAALRLNVGHLLYSLSPGDLHIYLHPPYWSVPLLSPPFMAVIWRPLAVLPYHAAALIWLGLMTVAMAWAAYQIFVPSPLAVAVAAPGLGYLLGSGNIHGFMFAVLVTLWLWRGRTWPAALLGIVTAAKIMPVVFVPWLLSERHRRPIIAFVVAALACSLIGVVGAGLAATRQYPDIMLTSAPQAVSLSYLTKIRWLSPVLTVVGMIATLLLHGRRSYQMAVLTMVLFNASGIGFAGGSVIVLLALPREPRFVTAELAGRRLAARVRAAVTDPDVVEYALVVGLIVLVEVVAYFVR
jgi:hypothetical protein